MNESNDLTMLDAVERYIRGEMGPDERLHFENLRKSNSEIDQLVVEDRMSTQIIGSPSTVRAGLDELMESTAADELMVTTIVHGHDDRLRSFELLSEVAERTPSLGRSAAHT